MTWKTSFAAAALLFGSSAFAGSYGVQSPAEIRDSLNINVGGGVEGYTGELNSRVNPGPSWSATLGFQPLTWMGAEVSYTGTANEVDTRVVSGQGLANGADIVRNGGQIAGTFNLPTPYVQPYALLGVGVDRYTVRGNDLVDFSLGYQDDTAGRVPVGGGLHGKIGPVNADARFTYNALFDDNFADAGEATSETGGSYMALLQVGGRF